MLSISFAAKLRAARQRDPAAFAKIARVTREARTEARSIDALPIDKAGNSRIAELKVVLGLVPFRG